MNKDVVRGCVRAEIGDYIMLKTKKLMMTDDEVGMYEVCGV